MQALVMHGFGDPSQLTLAEMPKPACGPDELLVQIGAVALNPVDWKEVAGMLKDFNPPYPPAWIPGFDGSGVVAEVGANVTGFAPGDRVLARPDRADGQGVLAEFARVQPDKAAIMPGHMSHAAIACVATAMRTAWQAFRRPDVCHLEAGQSVLIDGASGGVGSYAVALAKAMGARVCGTCRPENADYVRRLGADLVLDYRDADLLEHLRQWAPGGLDAILDCSMGGQKVEMLDLLVPGGCLIALATLDNDGNIPEVAQHAEAAGKRFHFLLMDYDRLAEDMAGIAALEANCRLARPHIAVYPFARAVEAMEAVKAGGVRGKIVVEVAALA